MIGDIIVEEKILSAVILVFMGYVSSKKNEDGERQVRWMVSPSNSHGIGRGMILYDWTDKVWSKDTRLTCDSVTVVLGKEYENSHDGRLTRSWQIVDAIVSAVVKPTPVKRAKKAVAK